MLTTHNLLEGMGVGDAQATALAATLSWLVRDGAGMLSSLAFSTWGAHKFDLDVKTWRLFADVINDAALLLEFCAPLFPRSYFLPILCVAAICKALCGVAAGCTRGVVSQHFAGPSSGHNLRDVAAKESTQETAVRLVGLWGGFVLAPYLLATQWRAAVAFVALTAVHAWANYVGISCLALNTLNMNRIDSVLAHLVMAANVKAQTNAAILKAGSPSLEDAATGQSQPMLLHQLSTGTVLVTLLHRPQIPSTATAVNALQEYALLLEASAAGAQMRSGWMSHVGDATAGLLQMCLLPFSLGASLLIQLPGWAVTYFGRKSNAAQTPSQETGGRVTGLAVLLPTPAETALEESIIPARNWSRMAHSLTGLSSLAQCLPLPSRAAISIGCSMQAFVASKTPYVGLQCARSSVTQIWSAKDRAAIHLALHAMQRNKACVIVVNFGTANALEEQLGVKACKFQVMFHETVSAAQRFQAYATAALLRPIAVQQAIGALGRRTIESTVQACVAGAQAAHACFDSQGSQHDKLSWAERWRHMHVLLPDEGWRVLQSATDKTSPNHPGDCTLDEQVQAFLASLDDLAGNEGVKDDTRSSMVDVAKRQRTPLRIRARSTGRKGPRS
jgi:hypothetical protein